MKNQTQPNAVMMIIDLIQAYLKRLDYLTQLASLEARLAVKTVFNLIVLLFIACILLLSVWLCALTVLFFYLVSLHYSLLFSAAVMTLLNLALLLGCGAYMWKIKHYLFFSATRKHLYSTVNASEGIEHEQPETTN